MGLRYFESKLIHIDLSLLPKLWNGEWKLLLTIITLSIKPKVSTIDTYKGYGKITIICF